MAHDIIFCGNARKQEFENGGHIYKIGMNRADIKEIVTALGESNTGWVNIVMAEKRTVVEGKPTHYLKIDEWEPRQQD